MINETEKNSSKRRDKLFNLYKTIYGDFKKTSKDDYIFAIGEIFGFLTNKDKSKTEYLKQIQNLSFFDGVFYAIENKIVSERRFTADMIELIKKSNNVKKENYTG